MPEECSRIARLYEEGKIAEAKDLQLSLLEINHAVTARWGVPGLKAALDLLGCYGGPPRLPLLSLGKTEKEQLSKIMSHCGLL